MNEGEILELIKKDQWKVTVLQAVKTLDLPDWWIGAGFVRSKVWDTLHEYAKRTPLPDIDVIYFDKNDFKSNEINSESTKSEKKHEARLKLLIPNIHWSVTNQARMHIFHHDKPYKNSTGTLSRWVETATCIGVKLNNKNELELTAPHGISDLTNLILRPKFQTPKGLKQFHKRIQEKKWLKKWPKLKIILD